MYNNEELLRKWQLKKIATLAFINDECDDMKPKDRKAFYSMMEAIFGEIVGDLKNLTLAAVINNEASESSEGVAACDHHWLGIGYWDNTPMNQCTKCNLFTEAS